MSRWIKNFEEHAFQNSWKDLLEISLKLNEKNFNAETTAEIARFNKVLKIIDETINSCDPELVPTEKWDNFERETKQCFSEINTFLKYGERDYIVKANYRLDNLLSYIKPHQTITSKAARSANNAFREYSKTINASLSLFKNENKKALNEIGSLKEEAYENLRKSNEYCEKIKLLENSYFDDTESESLKTRIHNFEKIIQEKTEEITSLSEKLSQSESESKSISDQIHSTLNSAKSEADSIKKALSEVEEEVSDFFEYHIEVFGEKNEEGEFEGGLKSEINARKAQLDDFKEKQEKKYNALNEQIESLLPGATSAGLATAYFDLKSSFDSPIKKYTRLFYISLVSLVLVSLISITQEVSWSTIKFVEISNLSNLASNILHKLPIVLPILWISIFASKRRSESLRLQQEYAHKEALAKSYQSFKTQIESLNGDSEHLMEKLLEATIDAVSMNASETLDKKHGDKTPLSFGLDEILKNINKTK